MLVHERERDLFCWFVFISVCVSQACRAYEQFMVDVVKLIRRDRGLQINQTLIQEDVTRVMNLEKDIANVSSHTQRHTHTHRDTHSHNQLHYNHDQAANTITQSQSVS